MSSKPLSVDLALIKAKTLAKKGELNQAMEFYRAVLEKFPGNKRAIEGLKSLERPKPNREQIVINKAPIQDQINGLMALYNQGRLQEALELGAALAEQYPNVPLILNILGAVNAGLGRLDQAVASYTKALQIKPDFVQAHNNLGIALNDLGRHEEAIASYTEALQIKPDFAGAHNNLGSALKALGKHEKAIASYTEALQIKPDYAEAHYNLGIALNDLGKHEQAITSYTKALQIKPDYAEVQNNLGIALSDLQKHEEAIASYTKALQIKPDYAEAHNNLGNTLNNLGKHEQAIASLTKALQIKPDYAEAHNNLGNVLKELGKHEEAIASYSKALQLKPDYAKAHNNLGNVLKVVGKHEEAIASLTKALQIKPDYAEAQRVLGTIKTYKTNDPQIARMLDLVADPSISENEKMHLGFALGKAFDDIGDAERAFRYFLEGNHLRKKELGYNIDSDKRLFSLIKSTFATDKLPTLEEIQPVTGYKKQPIFIVGMPRSGTTLVEQILASHSQIYGAGELIFLNKIVKPVLRNIKKPHFNKLTINTIISVLNSYLAKLDNLGDGEPRITDKMPLNFRWIGFILTAMPEAKVINLQRDPVATCWSVFKQGFSSKGNGYAYDLVDVAEYYKLYIDLMDFWRGRFPNQFYDLDYESLTENQEEETRKLIKYCALDWEDQCLEFHKTKRAVNTASSFQVRQAMYKGSSEAWRKYEAHIQPMLQALKG
jgi:tetratricopeptide (TPR) repeat protein